MGLPTPTGLTKASSATGAAIGEEFTYTITVPGTAVNASLYDVGILDTLPDAYTLVSATSNGGGPRGGLHRQLLGAVAQLRL